MESYFDQRDIISIISVEVYKKMLHTIYLNSAPVVSEMTIFNVFPTYFYVKTSDSFGGSNSDHRAITW